MQILISVFKSRNAPQSKLIWRRIPVYKSYIIGWKLMNCYQSFFLRYGNRKDKFYRRVKEINTDEI